jgi:hypothetical protein
MACRLFFSFIDIFEAIGYIMRQMEHRQGRIRRGVQSEELA